MSLLTVCSPKLEKPCPVTISACVNAPPIFSMTSELYGTFSLIFLNFDVEDLPLIRKLPKGIPFGSSDLKIQAGYSLARTVKIFVKYVNYTYNFYHNYPIKY